MTYYSGYNTAPWLQATMPSYQMFNSNIGMPVWGGYSSSSSTASSSNTETREEYEARKKREFEEAEKNYVQRLEYNKGLTEVNKAISKIEKGKQKDGSVKIETSMEDYKKLPWWKKATRAVSNMAQGAWKLCTTFVGMEEDGSWNWKKGLFNVGTAAAILALTAIPGVGPILSTGLLYGGAIAGAWGVGNGIYKATKAKSVTELDHAFQDIGSGAFIGISSVLGIRSLSKAGGPLTGNFVSRAYQACIKNPWKATMQQAQAGRVAAQNDGFLKMWWKNIKAFIPESAKTKFDKQKQSTIDNYNNRINEIDKQTVRIPKVRTRYQAQVDRLEAIPNRNQFQQQLLDKAKANLADLKTLTAPKKALLQQEKSLLEAQIQELQNCSSKASWTKMKKESVSHKELQTLRDARVKLDADGTVNIGGTNLDKRITDDIKGLEELISRMESISKEMKVLSKQRYRSMRTMALRSKKYKHYLDAYTGSSSRTKLGYQWDINKGELNLFTLPFKALWKGMNLMFKPWLYFDKHGATGFYKIQEGFFPTYEANMLDGMLSMMGKAQAFGGAIHITAEECNAQLTQLNEQKAQLENALATLKSNTNFA